VLLGGILIIAESDGFLSNLLLVIAIAFGTINVIGGFLVTDRMLEMFKKRPKPADKEKGSEEKGSEEKGSEDKTEEKGSEDKTEEKGSEEKTEAVPEAQG